MTFLQYLLPQHLLSKLMFRFARIENVWIKGTFTRWFVNKHQVNLAEAERNSISDYAHFNDFFTRTLKPQARPISESPIIWAVGGTVLMIALAWILRLVGIEYDLQKREAAYRKILVIAEDDGSIRPKSLEELFDGVRTIHYNSYLFYLYFNIGRLAYLQANVLVGYIFLAPAIVAGVMTLGVMQQILRAFGRVEGSLQYLFNAWPTIIELASVYKRLREFERQIDLMTESEVET